MITVEMKCISHPRYKGKRAPKAREESNPQATCYGCWAVYFAGRGLTVPTYLGQGRTLRFRRVE